MSSQSAPASETEGNDEPQLSTSAQLAYWESISVDVNGMLGGYPQISRVDIQFSRIFLAKIRRLYNKKDNPSTATTRSTRSGISDTAHASEYQGYAFSHALEAGAGIGRVTLQLLAPLCAKIDIIEPIQRFTDILTAPTSLLVKDGQLERVWNVPLQEWSADSIPAYTSSTIARDATEQTAPKYDLIYNQWCLNHLSQTSLVTYLRALILLLDTPNGWIIVKENLSTDAFGADIFDPIDSSVTRSDGNWRAAFREAGLQLVHMELQRGFPKELRLYPVGMYALRPAQGGA
ncbi:uncharacterized protein A1O9_01911 [Exophiala aquamarina CBS 119918]|uniref:Alpha N-terminal protein methyltransferase 1 n=1 Tax=Exophiala aquamarina CBS 119918 TaxID=1182545 RepID=A0A072PKF6_9EURO|nr:uncharacterized protein A1O9_01911 [Exophiala aquamarina CBS 119918]KEF60351.1 hypothetical protein A1O9_01911 [Exophiala aquamarina CBS 119918]